MRLLRRGAEHRHVGETRLNRESSRSHSVFTCVVERVVVDRPGDGGGDGGGDGMEEVCAWSGMKCSEGGCRGGRVALAQGTLSLPANLHGFLMWRVMCQAAVVLSTP
jgi:hypothetical protein